MFQIKQSEATAARRRIPVLLVDLTDGYTPETGVVTPTINISKNGATVASGAGTWTEIGNGQYYYEFTTGEVDTLGWISVNIEKATVTRDYNAVCQIMAYDYAVGTNLGLSALPTASPNAANGIITFGTGTGQLDVVGGRADADVLYINGAAVNTANAQIGVNVVSMASGAVASIWNALTSGLTTVGSIGKLLVDNVNATISSRSTLTAANVWDYLTSAATTVGSLGKLIVDNLNATISSRSTLTAANVWDQLESNITTASSIGVKLKTNLDTTVSSRSTLTAANVWSETLPGTYTSTQAGFKLNAAGSAADPWSTALPGSYVAGSAGYIIGNNLNATVGSRMATFTLPTNFSLLSISGTGAVTAGTVSDKTGYSLSGTQTFNLTGSITGNLSGSVGSVTGSVGSVTGSVGSVTGSVGSVTGSVGSISNPASIWDHLASNVTTLNSIGLQLKTNIDATISSRLASSSYTTPPTVTQIWQQSLPGTFTLGQAGYILGTNLNDTITSRLASSSYTAPPTVSQIWQQTLPGTFTLGQAGYILGTNLNDTITSRMATFTYTTPPTTSAITSAIWNQDRATANGGSTPAAGTFGYYLDSRVSTAGGGGGGVIVKTGPFTVSANDLGPNGILDLVKNDNRNIQLFITDQYGEKISLNGAYTYSVKTYDLTGALVKSHTATLDYAAGGLLSFDIDTVTTANTGTYNVVVVENNGTTDKIYGGLKIEVRL